MSDQRRLPKNFTMHGTAKTIGANFTCETQDELDAVVQALNLMRSTLPSADELESESK
jgi:hypothetical protein